MKKDVRLGMTRPDMSFPCAITPLAKNRQCRSPGIEHESVYLSPVMSTFELHRKRSKDIVTLVHRGD
jgi:hypothetical protein